MGAHNISPSTADTPFLAVYSFGDGNFGALGLQGEGILEDDYTPTAVSSLPLETVGIAAGHYHSFAITAGGRLWAWGRNKEGQLGRAGASGEDEGGWSVTYRGAGSHDGGYLKFILLVMYGLH
jgi:alpha-tubulin suppressor-like RCC1 family protein